MFLRRMPLRRFLSLLAVMNFLTLAAPAALAQSPIAFEVATIKPSNPDGHGMLGFLAYPGGRVALGGANIKMLLHYALDIQEFQITDVPDWATKSRFDITAIPPAYVDPGSEKRPPVSATPNADQRKMILALLIDRFGLKYHRATKPGGVYFLLQTGQSALLTEAKNTNLDPRGGIMITMQGIPNGDAFGSNLSMAAFARAIGQELDRPVIDQTSLPGTYDFRVKAIVPNEGEAIDGILSALKPLGLQLKAGKAPVESIVIDSLTPPTSN